MFFRSVCNPIFVGLGTAAIFAAGASLPAYAEPSESPSQTSPAASESPTTPAPTTPTPTTPAPESPGAVDPPSTPQAPSPSPTERPPATPTPAQLFVTLSLPSGKIYEGDTIYASVHVHASKQAQEARLKLSATGSPKPSIARCATPCDLGTLGTRGRALSIKLTVPDDINSSKMTLTAQLSASGSTADTATRTVSITKKLETSPSPTPSPTNTGGTGTGGTGTGGTGTGGTGTGGTGNYPAAPTGSFGPSASVPPPQVFPGLTPGDTAAPNPAIASNAAPGAATSVLRSNERRAGQELRFEQMASTQAAWLAALMVAFSLLLTQIRLGRRPAPAAAAGKGAHRRPRRGMFSA